MCPLINYFHIPSLAGRVQEEIGQMLLVESGTRDKLSWTP